MPPVFVVSIVVGRLITRTGRYKGFMLAGLLIMGAGYYLLTRLVYGSTQTELTLDMVVVGLGLGAVLQTYTLVVQNATSREDLGVATPGPTFSVNCPGLSLRRVGKGVNANWTLAQTPVTPPLAQTRHDRLLT